MAFLAALKQVLNKTRARAKWGVVFKDGCLIDSRVVFAGGNCVQERAVVVDSIIGFGTYISWGTLVQSAKIGKFCCIGPNIYFASGTHPTRGFVSMHPAFFSNRMQAGFSFVEQSIFKEDTARPEFEGKSIWIGNDVWIGASATILPGVRIGDGAIVAAGTVVHKDVEAFSVVAGCPMREIRKRFSPEIRKVIQSSEWWNWDLQTLKERVRLFADADQFAEIFSEAPAETSSKNQERIK